jgi:pentatricopeptide repeat protein
LHQQDSALAATCVHGTEVDCSDILQRRHWARVLPTIYSYNALLDRAARRGDEAQAAQVMQQMRTANVTADSTTYNTLLKLCFNRNDTSGAMKVRSTIFNKHIFHDGTSACDLFDAGGRADAERHAPLGHHKYHLLGTPPAGEKHRPRDRCFHPCCARTLG